MTAQLEDAALVTAAPSRSVLDHWCWNEVHLAVHTLLFSDTLSSNWPLTYQQCQSKRMIESVDTAIARGRCEISADLARRVMPRGDSSFSLARYGEYQNNAPTDSAWHAGVPVTVSGKCISCWAPQMLSSEWGPNRLYTLAERRSTSYSVYCWLAKPHCLSQDIRKEDSWAKKLVYPLSSVVIVLLHKLYTVCTTTDIWYHVHIAMCLYIKCKV